MYISIPSVAQNRGELIHKSNPHSHSFGDFHTLLDWDNFIHFELAAYCYTTELPTHTISTNPSKFVYLFT